VVSAVEFDETGGKLLQMRKTRKIDVVSILALAHTEKNGKKKKKKKKISLLPVTKVAVSSFLNEIIRKLQRK
jgi:hypothetical protein